MNNKAEGKYTELSPEELRKLRAMMNGLSDEKPLKQLKEVNQ